MQHSASLGISGCHRFSIVASATRLFYAALRQRYSDDILRGAGEKGIGVTQVLRESSAIRCEMHKSKRHPLLQRRGRWRLVLAIAPLLFLGACASAPEWADPTGWLDDSEPVPENQTVVVPEGQEESFPNLASVPDEAPEASSKEERERLAKELTADRDSANYSTEPLRSSIRRTASAEPAVAGAIEQIAVIYFDSASAELDSEDLEVLRQVFLIHQSEGGVLKVQGHASGKTGTVSAQERERINLEMSARRAESVAQALRNFGIASAAILVEALSDSKPVYEESTANGEAWNRRAEIFLELQSSKR